MSEANADTAGTKRGDWMNGKPFIVTDEMMSSPWSGFRDGRMFRCHICGEFFKPGMVARFVWCNGIKEAQDAGVHCGNVMVCSAVMMTEVLPGPSLVCDGPDIYKRLAEHERIGKARYWHLLEPDRLPSNPHSPHRSRRRARP